MPSLSLIVSEFFFLANILTQLDQHTLRSLQLTADSKPHHFDGGVEALHGQEEVD